MATDGNVRTPFAILAVIAAAGAFACASIDDHFGPGLVLQEAVYPEAYVGPRPISARQALRFALRSLEQRGVNDIRLCRIDWIVAGVGGAIVHATGRWEKDGGLFEAFAVGICDGTEVKHGLAGGDEFFVLARGVDRSGAETYYYSDLKGADPRILRYKEIDGVDELIFEFASPEALAALPTTCGIPAGRTSVRDLH